MYPVLVLVLGPMSRMWMVYTAPHSNVDVQAEYGISRFASKPAGAWSTRGEERACDLLERMRRVPTTEGEPLSAAGGRENIRSR